MFKWHSNPIVSRRPDVARCIEGISASLRAFHVSADRAAQGDDQPSNSTSSRKNGSTGGFKISYVATREPGPRVRAAAAGASEAASLQPGGERSGYPSSYSVRSSNGPLLRTVSGLQTGVGRGGFRGGSRGGFRGRGGAGGFRGGGRGRGRGGRGGRGGAARGRGRGRGRKLPAKLRDPNSKILDTVPYDGEPFTPEEMKEVRDLDCGPMRSYVPALQEDMKIELSKIQKSTWNAKVRHERWDRLSDDKGTKQIQFHARTILKQMQGRQSAPTRKQTLNRP